MHPHRTRISGEIVAEFVVPKRRSCRTVVLCDGMPSVPCRDGLMKFLARQGYWAVHPRYRGTWESGGRFLERSPHEDIVATVRALRRGLKAVWDGQTYFPPTGRVYVLGSSFGGAAALLSSGEASVTRAVALSPVIDWSDLGTAEPMDFLYRAVRRGFGEAYRISPAGWRRLGRTDFYSPARQTELIDGGKCLVLHAEDDDIVPASASRELSRKVGCDLSVYRRGGHFGLSDLMRPRTWGRVSRFLKADG